MARLNTANPLNTAVQRKKSLKERSNQLQLNDSTTVDRSTSARSSNGSSTSALSRASSQRHSRESSAVFDIFSDDSPILEGGNTSPGKQKKSRTLKAANVNSLLLPIGQTPRQRPSVKLETDDYEKENDILENTPEHHTTTGEEAPQGSPTRQNMSRTPRGGRADNMPRADNTPLRLQSRNSETEEDSEDNSFDSLDDFIVSDNEDPSFHETSASETEDEMPPSPPPPPKSTRKRLIRGRRPDTDTDTDKTPLNNILPEAPFRLEPRVPQTPRLCTVDEDSPKQVSQGDLYLSTKLNSLNINGDNEPATQLETKSTRYGLQDVFVYQDAMVFADYLNNAAL